MTGSAIHTDVIKNDVILSPLLRSGGMGHVRVVTGLDTPYVGTAWFSI